MPAGKILIVEDERIVAMDLSLRLAEMGYIVVGSVASGEAAIDHAERLHPDLVLMDIRLSGKIDGIAAAQIIRKQLQLPVIFLTAHSDDDTLERARKTEPNGYLIKPFQERELRTAIEMAVYKNQAERQLRASERRFAATLSSIHDAVVSVDPAGIITFANPVAEKILGNCLGKHHSQVFQLFSEATREPVPSPISRALQEQVVVGLSNHVYLLDQQEQELIVEDCASPIIDQDGQMLGAVLVFRDLTQQKKEQQLRESLNQRVREASKIEAIGRLAGGIAHDFNNLLTVINGQCELLFAQMPEDHPFRETIASIYDAGERAARLTNQMLTFSRRSSFKPEWLNLNQSLIQTGKMVQRMMGELITIEYDLAREIPQVKIDPTQFEQVTMNLMVNAKDAMPTGGTIRISTRHVRKSEPVSVDGHFLPINEFIELRIADTGEGIAEEHLNKLFEPFFTTKSSGRGTGLGLAVVYGIIQQSGGDIRVESTLGQGTEFIILLPITSPQEEPEALPEAPQILAKGHETILLVEDDEMVRRIARIGLETQGYRVIEARGGPQALELTEKNDLFYDLLVTDVIMPNMSGRELASRLRIRQPSLRVLYMSGYTDDVVLNLAITPHDSFLQKPFTPLILARRVRQMLDTDPPSEPTAPAQ